MERFNVLLLLSLIISAFGQKRILDGQIALEGEFPYQAMIYDYHTYCGGSIINKRWILTVAHCSYKNYATLGVFVGTNKNLGIDGTRYKAERFIKHERNVIKSNLVLNDIALIRVANDIQFNRRVQPVRLPYDNSNRYVNKWAIVSGWGKLKPSNPNTYLPRSLRYATVQVIEQQKCRRLWPNLADHNLCTSVSGGQVTCDGDSGDPLVIGNTQIGIVSYADAECGALRPVVYTRVSSFLPWIQNKMNLYFDRLY